MAWLEDTGYPYNFLLLLGSGTYTDNSPPGDTYCSIVQDWNQKFGSTVAIRTATLNEFFERLERDSQSLPTYRGELPINFWEAPFLKGGISVHGSDSAPVVFQVEQSPCGWSVFVLAELIPGQRLRYRIVSATPRVEPAAPEQSFFENKFYRIAWTPTEGIVSLLAKASGAELLKADSGGLGCPVYQIFPGANRSQAGAVAGPRTRPHDEVSFGRCVSARRLTTGPLFEDHEFEYEVPGTTHYQVILRCYRDRPHFEVNASIIKTEVDDPEGLYVYFPLAVPDSRWALDKAAALIKPGVDQIPGTCCDYYSVLSGAAQVGPKEGIAWVTLDAPLVQIGALRLWRFTTSSDGTGPLYSWITNNKWQTNTRYRVGGSYEMRYRVQAGSDLRDDAAARIRAFDNERGLRGCPHLRVGRVAGP